MNPLRAIVIDTWRQSRQQTVFIIMLVLLGIISIAAVVLPHPFEDENGTARIGVIGGDGPSQPLEDMWMTIYVGSVLLESETPMDPFGIDPDTAARQEEAFRRAEEQTDVSLARRSVEVIVSFAASTIFTISMLLFLAASAGYIPNMLESGAIDVVLAKPVDRLRIWLAKYLGGLALYAAAIAAAYFVIFVGLGLHTGEWVARIFLVMPLQLFCAAVLFAIIAALGVVSRSSTLCLVVGLLFYLVVDSVVGGLIQGARLGVLRDWPWLETAGRAMRYTLPNFDVLKANATASVFQMPLMQWQPFLVALAWLVVALAFGYWRFSKSDY
jgi:ABC-type transport system involved in multi-copper enzyme maturation permease subunit